MWRLILVFSILVSLGVSSTWGYSLANPSPSMLGGKLRISADYTIARRVITSDSGPDFKVVSNRLLLKPSYSPLSGWELFGLLGSADLNFKSPDPIYLDNYDGTWELAFGFGSKIQYYNVALDANEEFIIRFYATGLFFSHFSRGEIDEASIWLWKSNYRWQEYMIGAYWSMQYNRLIPYLGLEWYYINGRVDRGAYRMDNTSQKYNKFFDQTAYFADPTQFPKPVIGIDYMLPAKIILSLEIVPWVRDQTTVTVGISQAQ
ncbi:hypothetical protein JW877_09175 [bacterium]|nr:hypothetical protein [bacterium]